MADVNYDDMLALYRKLVEASGHDKVKGKANPYTSLNGNMFSFLDKSGVLCLRLPQAEREAFVEKFNTKPVVQYGAVMKEYVAVPAALIGDAETLTQYFARCLSYARTLPAK